MKSCQLQPQVARRQRQVGRHARRSALTVMGTKQLHIIYKYKQSDKSGCLLVVIWSGSENSYVIKLSFKNNLFLLVFKSYP